LFGSGYVLLAFLQADFVDRHHWLTQEALLDAVAVGQVTPGPVFTTATFIGYLLAGPRGAVIATLAIPALSLRLGLPDASQSPASSNARPVASVFGYSAAIFTRASGTSDRPASSDPSLTILDKASFAWLSLSFWCQIKKPAARPAATTPPAHQRTCFLRISNQADSRSWMGNCPTLDSI